MADTSVAWAAPGPAARLGWTQLKISHEARLVEMADASQRTQIRQATCHFNQVANFLVTWEVDGQRLSLGLDCGST